MIGGSHATYRPEEALEYADVVVPEASARRAEHPPRIDGVLNENLWKRDDGLDLWAQLYGLNS